MKSFLKTELTQNFSAEVKKIFEVFLAEEPDSIRLVGGCVRDMLYGKFITDFDFATKFLPHQTIEILEKYNIHAVPTGIKFGTITAVINKKHFEITTLRAENKHDGRHFEAQFIDDYFFDAARRDFTINALYLDFKGMVYDYFNGIADLQNGKVCFIGIAEERIKEDFLRILRFFRFSARYAKSLDVEGLAACITNKNSLNILSAERVRAEIFKILANSENEKLIWILSEMQTHKISEEIFLHKLQIDKLQNLLECCKALQMKPSEQLKFAALLFSNEINLLQIYKKLSFSNAEKKYFEFLFAKSFEEEIPQNIDNQYLREMLIFYKKEEVYDFMLLNFCENIFELKKYLNFIENFSAPKFPINGDDLIGAGLAGKRVGEALMEMKKMWIASEFKLKREDLLKSVK